jgi:hypothetical protein
MPVASNDFLPRVTSSAPRILAVRRAKLPNHWQKCANTVVLSSWLFFCGVGMVAIFIQISVQLGLNAQSGDRAAQNREGRLILFRRPRLWLGLAVLSG